VSSLRREFAEQAAQIRWPLFFFFFFFLVGQDSVTACGGEWGRVGWFQNEVHPCSRNSTAWQGALLRRHAEKASTALGDAREFLQDGTVCTQGRESGEVLNEESKGSFIHLVLEIEHKDDLRRFSTITSDLGCPV
jgi:hypothetical protein